jgi:hypothetical protein
MTNTDAGLEFWSESDAGPFLVRYSDLLVLRRELKACGVQIVRSFSSEFWDVNRFPVQARPLVRAFNVAWTLCCPNVTAPSSGVALIGEKRTGRS